MTRHSFRALLVILMFTFVRRPRNMSFRLRSRNLFDCLGAPQLCRASRVEMYENGLTTAEASGKNFDAPQSPSNQSPLPDSQSPSSPC